MHSVIICMIIFLRIYLTPFPINSTNFLRAFSFMTTSECTTETTSFASKTNPGINIITLTYHVVIACHVSSYLQNISEKSEDKKLASSWLNREYITLNLKISGLSALHYFSLLSQDTMVKHTASAG